jgi:hypothetical protein
MPRARIFFGSSPAFMFVLTMGVFNLLGDITSEGGASINGQFMASLGASAAIVSITAGLGEFLGYVLRGVILRRTPGPGPAWFGRSLEPVHESVFRKPAGRLELGDLAVDEGGPWSSGTSRARLVNVSTRWIISSANVSLSMALLFLVPSCIYPAVV